MSPAIVSSRLDPLEVAVRLADARAVAATRNAPAWVVRKLQAERRSHGLAELPAVVRPARPARSTGLGVIVGTCAYGPSRPVDCDWDRRSLVEYFSPDAFSASVDEIRAGFRSAWLSVGHTPDAVATTDDGSLALSVHPVAGLCFWARLDASEQSRRICERVRAGKMRVSVGFFPESFEGVPYRQADGTRGRCRVIKRARLSHVSLIDVAGGGAFYGFTRVRHVFNESPEAVALALHEVRQESIQARKANRS